MWVGPSQYCVLDHMLQPEGWCFMALQLYLVVYSTG
jgi:hypothetical protein